MDKPISTNIRMPASLHKKAKEYALRHRKSLAEVVREAVSEYVAEPQLRPDQVADDPFFSVIGIGKSDGEGNVHGKDHDDELYGNDR